MLPRRSKIESCVRPVSPVREAAAEFVRGTTFGWGRRELAEWLVCHYSPCLVADATADSRVAAVGEKSVTHAAPARIDDEHVERVILAARAKTLRFLTALAMPSRANTIVERAIRTGAVMQVHGSNVPANEARWLPAGKEKMLLAERVASLFVADFLESPEDYRDLSLCRCCGFLGYRGSITHDTFCERDIRAA